MRSIVKNPIDILGKEEYTYVIIVDLAIDINGVMDVIIVLFQY